jgi:methionyl-tRNA formyltransferase
MQRLAEQRGIPLEMPEDINAPAAVSRLHEFQAELMVVCDYGQILSSSTLATTRLGGINLHASLLPKYRGAAPINWAIYEGETTTGVTVIHMTPQLDAGPCLIQQSTPIRSTEDAVELEVRLAEIGAEAVEQAIAMLRTWDGRQTLGHVQDRSQVSRAPRLQKSHGIVDWSRSAQKIFDQVRAFKPWPGTYCHWMRPTGTMRLLLEQVRVDRADGSWGPPGTVVQSTAEATTIACGQGTLQLLEIQPAGKRKMKIAEFLRGYPLEPGQVLGEPSPPGTINGETTK